MFVEQCENKQINSDDYIENVKRKKETNFDGHMIWLNIYTNLMLLEKKKRK